jgi:predicted nucleic acid-binding protein
MTMSSLRVAVDASVLVALINPTDLWRSRAISLKQALLERQAELVYFDCVVIEAISAMTRRLQEKKRGEDTALLVGHLTEQVPVEEITWILPTVQRFYGETLDLIQASKGTLNFNDALIALACREIRIPSIASFDTDFDTISWLQRLSRPEDLS